jgi:hypothetical protein
VRGAFSVTNIISTRRCFFLFHAMSNSDDFSVLGGEEKKEDGKGRDVER